VLKGFREFVARGNVIDLAVGVVIGAAFTALVNAFVVNLINPLLGIFGTKSLSAYVWCLKNDSADTLCFIDPKTGAITGGVGIGWGAIVSAIITFLLTALLVYFVFVVPMNKFRDRYVTPAEEETAEEIALLREIRDSLKAQSTGE
jgi:large conductance mechanosensitive channel